MSAHGRKGKEDAGPTAQIETVCHGDASCTPSARTALVTDSIVGRKTPFVASCGRPLIERGSVAKKLTTDHGEIIHFAGRVGRFPVARSGDARSVRLASREDVQPDEVRVGWPAYFRPFIDDRLVFVYDDQGGRAMTRAQAQAEAAEGPAGPAGEASPQAAEP